MVMVRRSSGSSGGAAGASSRVRRGRSLGLFQVSIRNREAIGFRASSGRSRSRRPSSRSRYEAGQVAPEARRDLDEQAPRGRGARARALAVVEHHRKDGGEPVARLQLLLADDLLEQEADVGQHPHRHEGVGGGLELQQQVEVEPAFVLAPPAHSPDEVALALPQVVADEAAADPLQGARSRAGRSSPAAGSRASSSSTAWGWEKRRL